MAKSKPQITVCVPVYNGAEFVWETLESIRQQSFDAIKVLISVDKSNDDSVAVCQQATADSRFELMVQDQRLGWVGNCNWLLGRVETPLFCFMPHDDLIDPLYLETLLSTLDHNPDHVAAHSDIQCFGDFEIRMVQATLAGTAFQRALSFVTTQFKAVAFRALTRSTVLPGCRLYGNVFDDFAADTVWCFQLATRGGLYRVQEPLYRKRVSRGQGTHLRWYQWEFNKKLRAWLNHCLELALFTLSQKDMKYERALLLEALIFRLLRIGPFRNIGQLTTESQRDYVAAFLDVMRANLGRQEVEGLIDLCPGRMLFGRADHLPETR